VEDIKKVYLESWKLGLKSLALYRDGSKMIQPLSTSASKQEVIVYKPVRKRLPDERQSVTHKFKIGSQEGYLHVGLYEDGRPGELFITMSKQGSTLSGLMDAFATSISISLQYGVPLEVLVNKFIHTRFEPSGWTDNPQIQVAKSIMDYIFRWFALKFLPKEKLGQIGFNSAELNGEAKQVKPKSEILPVEQEQFDVQSDAPTCMECGNLMIRSGSCYTCTACGTTSGCS
jgi:ribonucleoside-diphosphate reductase alpha chain